MLNIKLAELIQNYNSIVPVGLVFSLIFVYQLLFLLRFEFELFDNLDKISLFFLSDFSNITTIKTNFYNLNYAFVNIKFVGFALFTNYLYHIELASLVLLLAMLAAIVLTLQKYYVSKTQNVYVQLLKDYNTALTAAT
jgi:NADH-quinone oxidoreductase subunit J